MIGNRIYQLAEELWPINRSLTGDGVRQSLSILQSHLEELSIKEVPSGTRVFDWTVPKEWRVKKAYIVDSAGRVFCNFAKNNLHLVGYSTPVDQLMTLSELSDHLHSIPEQPNAIPYVTSYYKETWGFCISHNERESLPEGNYHVVIDSELFNGSLTYGELLIPGKTKQEVFLSTYICHPSMANNELSGPTVTTFLAKWIKEQRNRKFSYRIVFIPETIGSLTYLSNIYQTLKSNVIAGYNVTCIGDDRNYSYLPSRNGQTLSDVVAKHVLKWLHPSYATYTWSDRGSDERQYCAPGIDLPVATIMRTKYGCYDEYHTSLDTLGNVVTPTGLEGGYNALRLAIEVIENNCKPKVTVLGEPQLGKRGLYPQLSTKNTKAEVGLLMDLISWSDGSKTLLEISEICNVPVWDLYPLVESLVKHELLELSVE